MNISTWLTKWRMLAWGVGLTLLLPAGCTTGPMPPGLIYTRVRLPLTRDLHSTPMPHKLPKEARIVEIREPISGLGLNARLNSNAIGEIAKANGLETLYFADQEKFSILGIWTSTKVILYGE